MVNIYVTRKFHFLSLQISFIFDIEKTNFNITQMMIIFYEIEYFPKKGVLPVLLIVAT